MLKKIPNTSIESIITRYQVSAEAQAVLKANMTPAEAISCLRMAKLYNDTVQFIAHALPLMEAIYWAGEALALRKNDWDTVQVQAINAALSWLNQPNETLRIRANQLADRVGLESAPAWIAKAVYWSGTGSIVAPDMPVVMPPAFLYSHAVSASITVAAAVPNWPDDGLGYEKFYQSVIEKGLAVAEGEKIAANLITVEEKS